MILFGAGEETTVDAYMGALRDKLGHDRGLAESGWRPLWVVDFPMFELDPETRTWKARHHPFTSPKDGHEQFLESAPEKAYAKAYDMVLNGWEVAGGSARIYRPEVQQQVFREQIRLAHRLSRPIVIHTREAEDDTFRILADERAQNIGGVFHCFTGDRDMAQRALDIGFHLSLAGIVTFPRALELKEVARIVPLDRLMIETDSPFLAPVPHRGKRNEPAYVSRVAEVIAELRGVSVGTITEATGANFARLFVP